MTMSRLDDAELIARLERALDAKAAEVRRPAEPFDPSRATSLADAPGDVDRPGRPRRRGLASVAAVAASVLAIAAAVGVAVRADDRRPAADRERTETGPTDETTPPTDPPADAATPAETIPDGLLAPGAVPDGLDLWSFSWSRGEGSTASPLLNHQLFEAAGGGRLLIDIDGQATLGGSAAGDGVTVRGVAGTVMPAKEHADRASTIVWEEGISLSATFTGMSLDQAVASLDGLTWRSDDRLQGFDPRRGGGLTLVAEARAGDVAPGALFGTYVYRDDPASMAPGAGRQLEVRTESAGPPGRDLLLVMLTGVRRDDGGYESFDPEFGTLSVAWPDGRTYWIDANATPLTEDELRQVAAGISATTAADISRLQATTSARVAGEFDLVDEARLPSGTVRLRESGGMRVVCLLPPDGDEMCPGLAELGDGSGSGPVVASLDVDGTWVVIGAAPQGVTYTVSPGLDGDPFEERPPLPGETASVGGLTYTIIQPPADVPAVDVTDPATGTAVSLQRPSG